MHLRTLNTIKGYLFSLLERLLPARLSRNSITSIYNYHPLNEKLATSGQPTEGQLAQIKHHGYQRVINLAPHSAENALANEAELVNGLGLEYIHLPVDFRNPDEDSFHTFCELLDSSTDQKVWLHCAANMRVSAFVYRYRIMQQGCDHEEALRDLHRIWKPWGVWKKFIARGQD